MPYKPKPNESKQLTSKQRHRMILFHKGNAMTRNSRLFWDERQGLCLNSIIFKHAIDIAITILVASVFYGSNRIRIKRSRNRTSFVRRYNAFLFQLESDVWNVLGETSRREWALDVLCFAFDCEQIVIAASPDTIHCSFISLSAWRIFSKQPSCHKTFIFYWMMFLLCQNPLRLQQTFATTQLYFILVHLPLNWKQWTEVAFWFRFSLFANRTNKKAVQTRKLARHCENVSAFYQNEISYCTQMTTVLVLCMVFCFN